MKGRGGLSRITRRLAGKARHRFPDREVIIRANGQVQYFQVSHHRQMFWAAAGLILTGWTIYSTVSYAIHNREMAKKNAAVEQAVAQYRNLRHNLTDAERKFIDIAHNLEEKNLYLQSILSQNAALRRNLDAIESVLDSVVAQRTRIAGERQSLEMRAQMLERRLRDMEATQSEVFGRLSQRTLGDIAQAERVLAMTGLDADTMLSRNGGLRLGQGGPFIPAVGGAGVDGIVEQTSYTAAMLDAHIDRLEGLQQLMQKLPLGVPTENFTVSSGFGVRRDPFNGSAAMHYGLDLSGQIGQAIVAAAPGKVVFASRMGFYGKLVEIDHGMGITTRYGHLQTINVDEGQIVAAGEKIGTMGNTGRSTGVHVHYEIRLDDQPVNPMKFIKAGRYVLKN